MGFGQAVSTSFSKYATFSGRARRSEFWWFYLAIALIVVVAAVLDAVLGTTPLITVVAYLALLLPFVAGGVRRLHDTDRSGWWFLLALVPLGGIVVLVFWCLDSTPGPNSHGESPKGEQLPSAAY